jgi:predicted nucleic acid-binding Zn finger protein
MHEAEFCTCDDFYFRVLDRKIHLCYHLIAQKIARNLGWYETIEETDELYKSLMNEWKKATA